LFRVEFLHQLGRALEVSEQRGDRFALTLEGARSIALLGCDADLFRGRKSDPIADESELGRAIPASAAPQSAQNLALDEVSAPHFGQRIGSGLPHSAQNRLPGKLSVPHLKQRIFPR
jgi:hypothetical protein